MWASPLRAVPTQAAPLASDPGVIDYADYAERFTPPGVDLGSGDLLKTAKDAVLNKLVEWGATSPEDSAWRRAMGVSYALTDAVMPGSYGEAAIGAGAGPLIGKGIVLGSGALNVTASKYALTSWAADDLGVLASRVGERLGANLAAPRRLNSEFGGVLFDLSASDAAETLAARRLSLNQKFGRTGDLNRDINYRGVIEQIRANVEFSVDYAIGTPRTYGRFGTKAHSEFERLNELTNQRIAGTGYSILTEQFRGPSIGGGPGLVTSRPRAAGSLGLDALVEYRGIPQVGLDLKTGRGWSLKMLTEIRQRFGVPVEQWYPR